MIDFFFTMLELLVDKFSIDSSTSNFKTLVVTTSIIEILMLLFSMSMFFMKEYALATLMLIIMLLVYIFSRNRIKELKNESRDVE